MTHYRIERDNGLPLEFEGECLAAVSSKEDNSQPRWSQLNIFKTDSGKYVVELLGCSTKPGEVTRRSVKVLISAQDVPLALKRKDEVEYLTYLAMDALQEAAEHDEDIRKALVERI